MTDGVYIPLFMQPSEPENEKINIKTKKFNVTNDSNELISSLVSALNAVKNLTTVPGDAVSPASQALIQAEITKIQSFQ
jgi:hypothetical protein